MEILFSLQAALSTTGRVGRVVDYGRFLVQDDQSTNHSRNPSAAGENRYDQERTTAFVQHSQRREDNR